METPNLERGTKLFEIGRYKDAISYFQSAIAEDIDDLQAKYLLAQCYFQVEDTKKALKLGLELRSEYPNDANIYFLLSQIYLHSNNEKEATENIDKAIEIFPYDANFFGQKAYIYISEKRFENALEHANKGLEINAKNNFCLNARTTALTKLNRKEEAKSTIENLLQDGPEDAHSHANVGWSYLENNDLEKAFLHFKESLTLNPNSEFARSGMVTAIKSKNKAYNLYLRYAFWMSNKSQKNQWMFIIGLYLAYRISVKALSATGLTYLAIPLIILYLLFALGSWIMDPLSNMLLLMDKYGKYLLDKQEKLSGQVLLGLLVASVLAIICSFTFKNTYFTILSLTFLATILPLTHCVLSDHKPSKDFNLGYGSIMLLTAVFGNVIGLSTALVIGVVGIMFVAYTWLGGFVLK